jgi:hypothetical protein
MTTGVTARWRGRIGNIFRGEENSFFFLQELGVLLSMISSREAVIVCGRGTQRQKRVPKFAIEIYYRGYTQNSFCMRCVVLDMHTCIYIATAKINAM